MIELFVSTILLVMFISFVIIKKKDLLNPLYLFSFVLLSTYFIYSLKLSNIQGNYGIKSVLLILLVLFIFIFASMIKVKEPKKQDQKINSKKYKIIVYLLFIIVVFCYLLMWLKLGPPPLISKVDRTTYFLSGIGTIYLLNQSLTFMIFYDILGQKIIGRKSLILLLIILFMIVSLSNKFQLFYLLCQYIVLYNLMKKRIKLKTFVYLLLVVIGIFVLYYNFIYNEMYISSDMVYSISKMKLPNYLSFLTTPYLYLSYNFDNLFNYIFNCSHTFGFGYYSFREIIESLNLNNVLSFDLQTLNNVWKNNLQYPWLTTGTIFREMYMDFSYIGIIIGTFIIGLISKKSYINVKKSPSIFNTYFYTSIIVSIFFLFFTNNFISINYIINLLFMLLISKYCTIIGGVKHE